MPSPLSEQRETAVNTRQRSSSPREAHLTKRARTGNGAAEQSSSQPAENEAGPSQLANGSMAKSSELDIVLDELSDNEGEALSQSLGAKEADAERAPRSALLDLDKENIAHNLPQARRQMMSILVGGIPPAKSDGAECLGLQDQWRTLRSTIKGTLEGEGNSALLVGAPGSGKSLLINSVVRNLSAKYSFHIVHLDAALQTTDRLSMRELARQLLRSGAIRPGNTDALDLEMQEDEEDDGDGDRSESDAADSGQDEVKREEIDNGLEGAVLSTIANTTSAILTLLSSGDSTGKPLLIVLSSFELLTARPRQALLYVLLDAVQAGSYTPGLCVLGTTSRVDTTDLLEKRVRSRFSGRVIDVWPGAVPAVEALKKVLSLGCTGDEVFDETWNTDTTALLNDARIKALLQDWQSTSNDFASLYRALTPIVASLTPEQPSMYSALLSSAAQASSVDFSTLNDLTEPEFALLIAAKQLLNKDREVFNFAMCFDELRRFVARVERDRMGASTSAVTSSGPATNRSIGVSWSGLQNRPRVLMAFRRLLNLELFQPDSLLTAQTDNAAGAWRSRHSVSTEFLRVRCTIFPQTIVEAAKSKSRVEPLGMHLVQWAQASG